MCVRACVSTSVCVCVCTTLLFHLSIAASLRPSRDHGNQAKYFISAHLVTTDPSHSPRSRVPTPPRPRSSPQKKKKKKRPKISSDLFQMEPGNSTVTYYDGGGSEPAKTACCYLPAHPVAIMRRTLEGFSPRRRLAGGPF